jgi:hypothetical protein
VSDEHVWRPGRRGGRDATCLVDLTRAEDGLLRARLLDLIPGRSGTVYRSWLEEQTDAFRTGVTRAALDPFRGYANALRDALPDAAPVLDPFHVVKLGSQMLDEVRRRVQQDTLGHRGHKFDPLYRIRNLLRHGAENPTPRQVGRLDAALTAGDPDWQVSIAWQCYQQLRSIYHAASANDGAAIAAKILAAFPSCPIPEVARLGRTLRAWRTQRMAYFVTERISNGGTGYCLLRTADGPTRDGHLNPAGTMLSDKDPFARFGFRRGVYVKHDTNAYMGVSHSPVWPHPLADRAKRITRISEKTGRLSQQYHGAVVESDHAWLPDAIVAGSR